MEQQNLFRKTDKREKHLKRKEELDTPPTDDELNRWYQSGIERKIDVERFGIHELNDETYHSIDKKLDVLVNTEHEKKAAKVLLNNVNKHSAGSMRKMLNTLRKRFHSQTLRDVSVYGTIRRRLCDPNLKVLHKNADARDVEAAYRLVFQNNPDHKRIDYTKPEKTITKVKGFMRALPQLNQQKAGVWYTIAVLSYDTKTTPDVLKNVFNNLPDQDVLNYAAPFLFDPAYIAKTRKQGREHTADRLTRQLPDQYREAILDTFSNFDYKAAQSVIEKLITFKDDPDSGYDKQEGVSRLHKSGDANLSDKANEIIDIYAEKFDQKPFDRLESIRTAIKV